MLYTFKNVKNLAKFISRECLSLKSEDFVIVEGVDVPDKALIVFKKELESLGIKVFLLKKSSKVLVENANLEHKEFLMIQANYEIELMKLAKAFIGIREPKNLFENGKLSKTARENVLQYFIDPVHNKFRNNNLLWLYFRLPSSSLLSGKTAIRVDNYFHSVFLDPRMFEERMEPLAERFRNTKDVKIIGVETELEFSLSGTGVYKSIGQHNLPDGEIFISPKLDSINGYVHFNVPTTYLGNHFKDIKLVFKKGKVVEASSNAHTTILNELLDIDEGARFCGEFAFGLNPFITCPINDILYDEKMIGSFHMALGNAYSVADNGNRSAIHWDLIQDMRKSQAKVYFDNELIMYNGRFLSGDLLNLNREELKSVKWLKL